MTDRNNVSRRRFLQATGGTAAAVAIAGCTGGNNEGEGNGTGDGTQETTTTSGNESTTTEGGDSGGDSGGNSNMLQLANSTMTTLDPVAATDTASGRVIQQIFNSLMNYPNGETSVENQLAESYETSNDNKTYTFTLREGVTFHNGDELTAQDFVYSFERLAGSPNSKRSYFILDSLGVTHETEDDGEGGQTYSAGTLGVEAVDDMTIEMTLEKAFHSTLEMLAYTSFAAIPQGAVGETPADEMGSGGNPTQAYNEFATSAPVGTGPYEFSTWEQGTEAEVTAYSDYYGEVKNGGVHWQIIEDSQALYNYGQNKNSDIVSIPSSQYDPSKISIENEDDSGRKFGTYGPMRNGTTANYFSTPLLLTYYVGFNMEKVEKPVRQAFAYVMNQQTMVEQVFKGRGAPAYHLTPPPVYPNGNYKQHAEESYPYGYNQSQVDQARQVMEEAGYGPDNMYEVQWTQYDSTTWEEMAKILRDQLQAAHIKMNIEKAPFSTLLQRGGNGNLEAYTLGWIADWPEADNFLQLINPPQTDTSQADAISYLNWSSDNGDAAQQATDAWETVSNNLAPTDSAAQARNEAYVQMEEANWEDVGFLNVYHGIGERFWYDWLDIEPYGGMGGSRQMYNNATVGDRQ
ncbi:ABC transporter substrate-binding protein [Halobium salinum]|uniref:ABC transporter substrate-binding protein n=1 Tax=Halobium salinum TaxID=1364940 RepID=A0ABD5PG06_9EURY|nr:ABC transporter substrate-binding protein [Halobium salinum]